MAAIAADLEMRNADNERSKRRMESRRPAGAFNSSSPID
jgi:hypothetical protein